MQLRKRHRRYSHAVHCWYCGRPIRGREITKDHQLPQSRGGSNAKVNIVSACKVCNNKKADMDVETYHWFLKDDLPLGAAVVFYGERA